MIHLVIHPSKQRIVSEGPPHTRPHDGTLQEVPTFIKCGLACSVASGYRSREVLRQFLQKL